VRLREQPADDRSVTGRPTTDTTTTDTTLTDRVPPVRETKPLPPEAPATRTDPPTPTGPRPRTSLFATLSLITGLVAALFVLTGTLAGYGLALGVLALVFALVGIAATGRRHVAGKSDALIGLALGLGAVVLGILVLTGSLAWLTMDGQSVPSLREWLDSQFVDRF
jgi:hypothetical protein